MTILFICNEYPPHLSGGIGIFVKSMAEEMVQRNHNCIVAGVYNLAENIEEEIEGVKVFRYGMKKRKYILPFMNRWHEVKRKRKLSEAIDHLEKQFKPHLIESFEWSGPLSKKPETKLLVRLHGSHSAHALAERKKMNRFLYYWERKNYQMADACVAVSHHIRSITEQCFGITQDITVIHNPLNPLFQNITLHAERKENMILFVGKYHERKGVQELALIMNKLLSLNSQYEFVFVGHHTAGQKEIFLSHISTANQHRLVFHQAMPQKDLITKYLSSALMIMPSRAEAFGLTAIEAMACGCLVAMNSIASAPEIITDNVTGLLIDVGNTEQCAQRIHELLSSDKKEIMRKEARERVYKDFGMNGILEKNLEMYKRLIES